ncbi:Uncharacterised protein (plasmid) [Tsukamurella tyrosinosolvens]|uniref:Uncharacterized protein n=3 Tax=Tsukamurella TaxID=2060 RepID=A0A3P8JZ00_TSUPA|nr:hypothetical protein [Tsukamurella pseudospumae]SDQ41902.1 hypothetical protein SAMN04489765_0339 [Tsukamurella pulmonis]SEB30986.1 hypothetical protein SAMN04489793_0176 [Tsukamurella tyrosinosolvens]VDR38509.1 Uncharacterised protein [Tsukamurella paurometabola]SUP26259.1 Uncharacterised protein [Tsukamurella pulmonis]VEH95327.1 Uncharacterised protein [Tsukamurella tyrosinosolvens]
MFLVPTAVPLRHGSAVVEGFEDGAEELSRSEGDAAFAELLL